MPIITQRTSITQSHYDWYIIARRLTQGGQRANGRSSGVCQPPGVQPGRQSDVCAGCMVRGSARRTQKGVRHAHRSCLPNQARNWGCNCFRSLWHGAVCRFSGWLPTHCMAMRRHFATVSPSLTSAIYTEIKCTAPISPERPAVYVPDWRGHGRRPTRLRLRNPTQKATTVNELAGQLPNHAWKRATIKEGSKGPIICDFAFLRIIESRGGLPAAPVWLVIRRDLEQPDEIKFYFSNAPATIPWQRPRAPQAAAGRSKSSLKKAKAKSVLTTMKPVAGWAGIIICCWLPSLITSWSGSAQSAPQRYCAGIDHLSGPPVAHQRPAQASLQCCCCMVRYYQNRQSRRLSVPSQV